jgi:hypothetical protein
VPWLPAFDSLLDAAPGRADDPIWGHVEGEPQLAAYRAASAAWLAERRASVSPIAVTATAERVVGEYDVELTTHGRTFVLPIAAVAERHRDGPGWLRVYHSQWPLIGRHVVRPPLLPRDPDARESDVVGEYQAALAAGDAARITATFEPDGCFREPAGPQFRRCGVDVLLPFFTLFFSAGGGIVLEHCTVTEDGVRTALEFNAVRWGGVDLPPQAGVAVYERGPGGKLAHARIYDDVQGPVE